MGFFEASRWAPSGSNTQPWRFAYGLRGTPAFDAILGCARALQPGLGAARRRAWWWWHRRNVPCRQGAPRPRRTPRTPSMPAPPGCNWRCRPTSKAGSPMPWAGSTTALARSAVQAHDDLVLHAVVALGRQGEASQLPEGLREREAPNGRVPLSALVFEGHFEPSGLTSPGQVVYLPPMSSARHARLSLCRSLPAGWVMVASDVQEPAR